MAETETGSLETASSSGESSNFRFLASESFRRLNQWHLGNMRHPDGTMGEFIDTTRYADQPRMVVLAESLFKCLSRESGVGNNRAAAKPIIPQFKGLEKFHGKWCHTPI